MRALALIVALLVAPVAVAAPVEHEPATIVIVVDRTMGAKTEAVRQALADAVSVLAPEDKIAVVGVDAKAQVVVPLQVAKDQDGFARKLAGLGRGSRVNVAAGIEAARAMLATVKAARKQILVITDTTAVTGVSALYKPLKSEGIVVSAVGVESLNRKALETIAYDVNGRVYALEDVTGLGGVLREESTRVMPPTQIALVIVMDRSGALIGPKLEGVKELARVAIEKVDADDQVAVVAFDSTANVLLPLQRPEKRIAMSAQIGRVTSGGSADVMAGLTQAKHLLVGNKLDRRILLLTLGGGSLDGVANFVRDLATDGVTTSVIGTFGADRDALAPIAQAGNGRLDILGDNFDWRTVLSDLRR